eukprot:TRINITY_DN18793_c0_g1_i1.p1 TRINITY_DN18793_c0_g1~~TRINITY_DN18793_c0_g1_i1.p1  ORF type:complete len:438 (-),score=123.74 TRINITY_DN18793_c0_g1_i1:121-1434(-)
MAPAAATASYSYKAGAKNQRKTKVQPGYNASMGRLVDVGRVDPMASAAAHAAAAAAGPRGSLRDALRKQGMDTLHAVRAAGPPEAPQPADISYSYEEARRAQSYTATGPRATLPWEAAMPAIQVTRRNNSSLLATRPPAGEAVVDINTPTASLSAPPPACISTPNPLISLLATSPPSAAPRQAASTAKEVNLLSTQPPQPQQQLQSQRPQQASPPLPFPLATAPGNSAPMTANQVELSIFDSMFGTVPQESALRTTEHQMLVNEDMRPTMAEDAAAAAGMLLLPPGLFEEATAAEATTSWSTSAWSSSPLSFFEQDAERMAKNAVETPSTCDSSSAASSSPFGSLPSIAEVSPADEQAQLPRLLGPRVRQFKVPKETAESREQNGLEMWMCDGPMKVDAPLSALNLELAGVSLDKPLKIDPTALLAIAAGLPMLAHP